MSDGSKGVDDVWSSMKDIEEERLQEYRTRAAAIKAKNNINVVALMKQTEKTDGAKKKSDKTKQKDPFKDGSSILQELGIFSSVKAVDAAQSSKKTAKKQSNSESGEAVEAPVEVIEASDMFAKISKYIGIIDGSDDVNARRNALTQLYTTLFIDHKMSEVGYNQVFREICKSVFKKIADSVEKCREMALRIVREFFIRGSDFVPILGYFIPAIMQRIPSGLAYDEDMKVFVYDIESHDAYRRGKAVERQDKMGVTSVIVHNVIEPAEEIRLLACSAIRQLIVRICQLDAASVLHPYFHEIIMFLQFQLRDPFPELKMEACEAIEYLALNESFVTGMKYFAVALVRVVLPVLRHRHAKVRVAAVTALKACMVIPDTAKVKGAGTEAMVDLVGFRDDNVLPVAGFYTGDVRINYLSEIVQDKSVAVREKVVDMLHTFLTKLGDRYDHQSRLLPYLLDLLTDESETVSGVALQCLATCGKEYEDEHPNDIIEKRQYGVDGSDKINISKPLPSPFTERPRIGVRLYVRGNTKRFLSALVNELTNWQSKTRYKSAQLLRIVIVLCEEHLTIEAHALLPSFIKAYGFSKEDKDKELSGLLLEVFELVGRYMLPDTYIYYILPRLRGDADVVQFGVDTATRVNVLEFLGALLSGTKPSLIPDYFEDIIAVLCDPYVVDPESIYLPASALQVIITLLQAMKGRGNVAVASNFMSTGRLTSLKRSTMSVFRFLLLTSTKEDVVVRTTAVQGLQLLSQITTDAACDVCTLYHEHGPITLNDVISQYEVSTTWHSKAPDHLLLQVLLEYPGNVLADSPAIFEKFLLFLVSTTRSAFTVLEESVNQKDVLEALARFLLTVAVSVCYPYYKTTPTASYRALKDVFIRLEEGKYKGVDECIDLQNNFVPGVLVTHGASTQKVLMDILRSNMASLLDTFIFNPTWSKTSSLQQVRLEVLGTLLGSALGGGVTGLVTDIAAPVISAEVLLNKLQHINDSVILAGKQPANPSTIRLATVSLIEATVTRLYQSSCYYIDDDTYNVVSYSKQSRNPAADTNTVACKKGCGLLLPSLLSCVDDSSDAVRLAVLHAVTYLVPLLEQENFDLLSNKLISEITSTSSSNAEAYSQKLDGILRSIATLDPSRMEELLRTAIPHLLQGVHTAPSDASQMISDLLTHCEMLTSFATVK